MSKDRTLRFETERLAYEFRSENGYSGTEPIHLGSLLLKLNVVTLFKSLSGSLAGMAIKAGGDLRFMMINQNHVLGKQHFTIGHELYHLFKQKNFTSQRCITGLFNRQDDIEERKADLFSAFLLLPEHGVKQMIPSEEFRSKRSVSEGTLFRIQHYYGVSMKAVIYRLWELGIVDKSYFDDYKSGLKSRAKEWGYDLGLYDAGNFGKVYGDYGVIAKRLYDQDKISESNYYSMMNAINVDPLADSEGGEE